MQEPFTTKCYQQLCTLLQQLTVFCMNVQVGDWGREGMQNQTAVAALMAQVADSVKPDFILSMGDNFYESTCCWPSWLDCTAQFPVYPPGTCGCAACWAELCKSKLTERLLQSLTCEDFTCICTHSPCIFDMMTPVPGPGQCECWCNWLVCLPVKFGKTRLSCCMLCRWTAQCR